MLKKYYLAYGSNLNLQQMSVRCPHAKPIGTLSLKDYRLVYKGSEDELAYLTVEKQEGSSVPLGVYEVTYLDIFSLDRYEGYPTFYEKYDIPIKIDGKIKKAFLYVMHPQFTYCRPTEAYIEICREGYKDFGFDEQILEKALLDTTQNRPKKLKK